MPAFSSPFFFSNHELHIRTLVRFVHFSSFFLSFLPCPEPFIAYNPDRTIAFSSHNKPRSRRRTLAITQMGSQKKNSKSEINQIEQYGNVQRNSGLCETEVQFRAKILLDCSHERSLRSAFEKIKA